MFFFKKSYKAFIFIYILLISLLTIYYLMGVNIVNTNNAMAEWVINYQGGFVRRGLLGELIYQISLIFNFNLRFLFLILQISLYLYYYYLIYNLTKNLKFNFLIFTSIFSPLFILFPLAELEALGRKEIVLFIILICSINFLFSHKLKNFGLYFISLSFPILILIFEASIFYCFFFISIILISCENFNHKYFLKLIFLSLPSLVIILVLIFNPHSTQETNNMCDALKKVGEICGMPTFFLSKKIGFHMQEVNWKIDHIFRYLLIFILGFGPLLILLKNSSFSQSKVNNITKKLPFIIFILIPIFFSLTMLVIAVDSGRWIHITFSCSIIIYLVMIRKGVVILNQNNSTIDFFNNKIHKLLKILIFFIICISWNPKAVHHEDLGSLPLYRVIEKTTNYYNNIWNIRVFQN